jgi:hypothetical protein
MPSPPARLEFGRQLVEEIGRDIFESSDERSDCRAWSAVRQLFDEASRHRPLRVLALGDRSICVRTPGAMPPYDALVDEAIEHLGDRGVDDTPWRANVVVEVSSSCLVSRPERGQQGSLELTARQDRLVVVAHGRPPIDLRRMS